MAWEENSRICLHMQLIAILSRTRVDNTPSSDKLLHQEKEKCPTCCKLSSVCIYRDNKLKFRK